MKIEYVNPFISGAISTFETMCGVTPIREGELELKKEGFVSADDLIGVIGLTGGLKGAVLMTMQTEVGLKLVSAFLMEEITDTNADLMDGFGEILNIIAGAAAAKLEGYNVKLAIPTVVTGQGQQIHSKQNSPWVVIPMKFPEWGPFKIEVSMEEA